MPVIPKKFTGETNPLYNKPSQSLMFHGNTGSLLCVLCRYILNVVSPTNAHVRLGHKGHKTGEGVCSGIILREAKL